MKRFIFIFILIILVLTLVSQLSPLPPAGQERKDVMWEIHYRAKGCRELITAYFNGFIVNGGTKIVLSQEQKDQCKADYNKNVIFLRDSVDYDALLAP